MRELMCDVRCMWHVVHSSQHRVCAHRSAHKAQPPWQGLCRRVLLVATASRRHSSACTVVTAAAALEGTHLAQLSLQRQLVLVQLLRCGRRLSTQLRSRTGQQTSQLCSQPACAHHGRWRRCKRLLHSCLQLLQRPRHCWRDALGIQKLRQRICCGCTALGSSRGAPVGLLGCQEIYQRLLTWQIWQVWEIWQRCEVWHGWEGRQCGEVWQGWQGWHVER